MKRERMSGQRIGPRGVRRYAEAVRAELRAAPGLTIQELCRRTGAPHSIVEQVRRRWREETRSAP